MNVWTYLNTSPFGAVVLVLALGGVLARLVRAARERRPVRVTLVCPACAAEAERELAQP